VPHLVPSVAGMGMCIIGLKSRKLGNRKEEPGIEDTDHNVSFLSLLFFYSLDTFDRYLFLWSCTIIVICTEATCPAVPVQC
jgi:hypothetical protein